MSMEAIMLWKNAGVACSELSIRVANIDTEAYKDGRDSISVIPIVTTVIEKPICLVLRKRNRSTSWKLKVV